TLNAYRQRGYVFITVPVYIGIGLRLSAEITALESGVALTGLGAIGAAAESKALSGIMTVQSLGINGRDMAPLPLPSKLDQSTIENAILALGSSRAVLYASDQTGRVGTMARVVGLYSPIAADARLINALYSELARRKPQWQRFCPYIQGKPADMAVA